MLHFLLQRKRTLLFLALANGLGSFYGYYWYKQQLAESPWYLWPLIPDSPLSASLFTIFLLLKIKEKYAPSLFLIANLMMIKYGFWAVVINLDVLMSDNPFTWENLHLTLSHAIMAIQGLYFLQTISYGKFNYILASIWLMVNDFGDYYLETHPYLFYSAQLFLAQYTALTLTAAVLFIAGWKLRAVQ